MKKCLFSCLETRIDKNVATQLVNWYGCYQLGEFAPYEALTIANSVRRNLLLEPRYCGISCVRIEKVIHEYSSLKGIKETIFDILINLKNIVLYTNIHFTKTQVCIVIENGPQVIQAKHIQLPAFISCVNPNQYITTIESDIQFKMIVFIDSCLNSHLSTSYYSQLYHNISHLKEPLSTKPNNFLLVNNHTSPILNVNYSIIKTIRQQELIVFEVCTDGSIHPGIGLRRAIQKLIVTLIPFCQVAYLSLPQRSQSATIHSKITIAKFLKLDLANFPISHSTYRRLRELNIYTFGDLYKFTLEPNEKWTSKQYKEMKWLMRKLRYYLNGT